MYKEKQSTIFNVWSSHHYVTTDWMSFGSLPHEVSLWFWLPQFLLARRGRTSLTSTKRDSVYEWILNRKTVRDAWYLYLNSRYGDTHKRNVSHWRRVKNPKRLCILNFKIFLLWVLVSPYQLLGQCLLHSEVGKAANLPYHMQTN